LNKLCHASIGPQFHADSLPRRRARTVPPALSVAVSRLALTLIVLLAASCTPYIPERLDFGTSALVPRGDISPEYAGFNNYDPDVNAALASQICATEYQPRKVATTDASPGQLITATGTCAPHRVLLGP
jgi:hypothetical protein